jgi:hypothetical protein
MLTHHSSVFPTIKDLLTGKATAQYPRLNAATFKRAERKRRPQGEQSGLF